MVVRQFDLPWHTPKQKQVSFKPFEEERNTQETFTSNPYQCLGDSSAVISNADRLCKDRWGRRATSETDGDTESELSQASKNQASLSKRKLQKLLDDLSKSLAGEKI